LSDHVVIDEEEIRDGAERGIIINVKGLEIGLFRVKGKYYALLNRCPHQGGPVCSGKVTGTLMSRAEADWKVQWVREGEIVTCPWHSLEYDIETGQSLAFQNYRLRTYPVKVEGGRLIVQI
jgi:nitrite reductase (NADH) small subunit